MAISGRRNSEMIKPKNNFFIPTQSLQEAHLICNLQRRVVSSEAHKSLLLSVRSDQRVDLENLHLVQSLDCLLDLVLVSAGINNENNRVLRLNLVHRTFSRQGKLDNVEVRLHTGKQDTGLGE